MLEPFKSGEHSPAGHEKESRGSQHDLLLPCQLEDGRGHLAKNAKGQEKLGADSQQGKKKSHNHKELNSTKKRWEEEMFSWSLQMRIQSNLAS